MVVIISIFLTIFALVWGVYWLFGEREDQRTRERLARQLGGGHRFINDLVEDVLGDEEELKKTVDDDGN